MSQSRAKLSRLASIFSGHRTSRFVREQFPHSRCFTSILRCAVAGPAPLTASASLPSGVQHRCRPTSSAPGQLPARRAPGQALSYLSPLPSTAPARMVFDGSSDPRPISAQMRLTYSALVVNPSRPIKQLLGCPSLIQLLASLFHA